MTSFRVDPGARVLWCLRRRASDVRCVLYADRQPIEVHIVQDKDFVLKESFLEEPLALAWADAYGKRLLEHGWHVQSKEDCSPSSAA